MLEDGIRRRNWRHKPEVGLYMKTSRARMFTFESHSERSRSEEIKINFPGVSFGFHVVSVSLKLHTIGYFFLASF